jgi:hypothetical protein
MEPDSPSSGWKLPRIPKVAVAVGLTAFLALAGAGLAFAVGGTGSSPVAHLATAGSGSGTSSTTVPSTPKKSGPRPSFGPAGRPFVGLGGGPGAFGMGQVVHGQYTVKSGSGYKTYDVQTGTVEAVSSSSIKVSSADGYSSSYSVESSTVVDSQAGGISTVAKNDQVQITALVSGQSATATSIVDTSKISSSRKGFGFASPGGGPPPGKGPSA